MFENPFSYNLANRDIILDDNKYFSSSSPGKNTGYANPSFASLSTGMLVFIFFTFRL